MSTSEIVKANGAALVAADSWESKLDLVMRTVAKDCTRDEFELFIYQAKRTGLDPLAKQIYAIKRQGGMAIQTGIDGYRLIADRTGKYAGNDDYEFDDFVNQPRWAKATVYKIAGGLRCPFSATARWDQYYPGDKLGFMWRKMPHVMLGKCAEALALRKAFPAELSGVYTKEEMDQADAVEELPQTPQRQQPHRKSQAPIDERELYITDEDVSVGTGSVAELKQQPQPQSGDKITPKQASDLFAHARKSGLETKQVIDHIGAEYGAENSLQLTNDQLVRVVKWIDERGAHRQ